MRAGRRRDRGRPHRHRRRHRQQQQHRRPACPGQPEPVDDRHLCGRRRLLRRRWASKLLAGRCFDANAADGRRDHALPRGSRRPSGRIARARRQRRRQRARRAAAGLRRSPQDAVGKQVKRRLLRRRSTAWSPIDDHRRRPGFAASARSASRSSRSCSATTATRLRPDAGPLRHGRSRRAVRAAIERVWKRIAPDVPFDAEFSEDIIAELYEAEDGARRRSSPASPCSR